MTVIHPESERRRSPSADVDTFKAAVRHLPDDDLLAAIALAREYHLEYVVYPDGDGLNSFVFEARRGLSPVEAAMLAVKIAIRFGADPDQVHDEVRKAIDAEQYR